MLGSSRSRMVSVQKMYLTSLQLRMTASVSLGSVLSDLLMIMSGLKEGFCSVVYVKATLLIWSSRFLSMSSLFVSASWSSFLSVSILRVWASRLRYWSERALTESQSLRFFLISGSLKKYFVASSLPKCSLLMLEDLWLIVGSSAAASSKISVTLVLSMYLATRKSQTCLKVGYLIWRVILVKAKLVVASASQQDVQLSHKEATVDDAYLLGHLDCEVDFKLLQGRVTYPIDLTFVDAQ